MRRRKGGIPRTEVIRVAGIPPSGQKTLMLSAPRESLYYTVHACDNAALVLLHYCALASVKCHIGKLLLHFVSFSGTFHQLLLTNECIVTEDT